MKNEENKLEETMERWRYLGKLVTRFAEEM